ncbi:XRE family transcriptional regulator [Nocardia yunnanensis]|uniref:XRE family transcriptional regulator n=1 Tax=Nocardia yunnanensis TaxID=2382165 RepID=A0A386ZFB6_9NOCA|nr:helix-turn-helix transcriptional regulator [Nocardia yunnanensis]AYF75315.1 XRE family transcriptional regulator [Nocardia yunnanensis]
MTTQHPEYLGQVVQARRGELGLSKQAIHAAVGLNPRTIDKIESGEAGRIRNDTLPRLDKVLGWEEGSASDAFTKRLPPRVIDIANEPLPASKVLYVPIPANLFQDTVRMAQMVTEVAGDDERLAPLVEGMNTIADRILRAWTIADIEHQRFDKTLSAATIEMLLGHYLRRTPQAPTADDHTELMYLRWLLGRLPESESERAEEFAQRWSQMEQTLSATRRINR